MPVITHFVFVDFENVPGVDLSMVGDQSAHVTLLLGKHQKKLDVSLMKVGLQLGKERFELVEVGAAGHNALDLTLAYYLGRAVQRAPDADFAIISKDKDFDPMIGHLQAKGVRVSRHASFASLPFLSSRKPAPSTKTVERPSQSSGKTAAQPKTKAPAKAADRLPRFITHLRSSPAANRKKLEHMIEAYFKNHLPAGGIDGIIADLQRQGIVTTQPDDKITVHKS